ncbi:MAG TPA: YciI family protein [Acidimicrobiia bacterium]
MRVMVLIKGDTESEAGVLPDEKTLTEMGNFNEELVKAGVMLAGEGLHPTSRGAKVRFSGGTTSVTQGPFADGKDLVAGFWIWQVDSLDEAIDWVKRVPSPDGAGQGEIEIRPIFELEDFGEAITPELREQEERLRTQTTA